MTSPRKQHFAVPTSAGDLSAKEKYKMLKRRIRDVELENEQLVLKLAGSKKAIQRLKFERKLLYDRLEGADPLENANGDEVDVEEEALVPPPAHALSDDGGADSDAGVGGAMAAPGKRKRRAARDPNAPKRPTNAYLHFAQLEREKLRVQQPELARTEVTKILGLRWKEMPVEEKKQYYDMYEKEKERYVTEMAEYQPGLHGAPPSAVVAPGTATNTPSQLKLAYVAPAHAPSPVVRMDMDSNDVQAATSSELAVVDAEQPFEEISEEEEELEEDDDEDNSLLDTESAEEEESYFMAPP